MFDPELVIMLKLLTFEGVNAQRMLALVHWLGRLEHQGAQANAFSLIGADPEMLRRVEFAYMYRQVSEILAHIERIERLGSS